MNNNYNFVKGKSTIKIVVVKAEKVMTQSLAWTWNNYGARTLTCMTVMHTNTHLQRSQIKF